MYLSENVTGKLRRPGVADVAACADRSLGPVLHGSPPLVVRMIYLDVLVSSSVLHARGACLSKNTPPI